MIILLFGEDTYRSKNKLKEVTDKYKKAHQGGLNLEHFEAGDVDYQDFKDQFRQASMFTEKKLAVVRNVFEQDEFKEAFLEDAERWSQSEDTIVLFQGDKVPKSDPLFKFVKNNGQWERFEPLEEDQLSDWAAQQFEKYEVGITSKALSTLVDFVGNDLWRLSNEIQKLANYKKEGEVEVEDVKLMVKPALETDIFKTIDAFALKNKNQALNLIQEHLDQGDSPLYLLHMINYQLRNLLTVKQLNRQGESFSSIKQKTDLHPYVVKKSLGQSKKFTLEEIKKIYRQLFEVDLNIKTGRVDKEPALKALVAKI